MRGRVLTPRRHSVKYGSGAVGLHYVLTGLLRKGVYVIERGTRTRKTQTHGECRGGDVCLAFPGAVIDSGSWYQVPVLHCSRRQLVASYPQSGIIELPACSARFRFLRFTQPGISTQGMVPPTVGRPSHFDEPNQDNLL